VTAQPAFEGKAPPRRSTQDSTPGRGGRIGQERSVQSLLRARLRPQWRRGSEALSQTRNSVDIKLEECLHQRGMRSGGRQLHPSSGSSRTNDLRRNGGQKWAWRPCRSEVLKYKLGRARSLHSKAEKRALAVAIEERRHRLLTLIKGNQLNIIADWHRLLSQSQELGDAFPKSGPGA